MVDNQAIEDSTFFCFRTSFTFMRRLSTFVVGMLVGGLLLWTAMNYHLVNTSKGVHLVPKVSATLAMTYVDVRGFTVADWARHADLVLALTQANQQELMGVAAEDALQNGLDRWLNRGEAN